MTSFQQKAAFENGFWLQILGDHARFIHDTLAPTEKQEIDISNRFITTFDRLLAKVQDEDSVCLSKEAQEEGYKLREFKLHLIEQHLVGKIKIGLSPIFISHMVNELDEYLRILSHLTKGEIPPIHHELHHHLIWLLDAAGHAGAISDHMANVEKKIKKVSDDFVTDFEEFYLKAVELAGFLRTKLTTFPALKRFNSDTSLKMKLFMNFLQEIEEMRLSKEALGTFAPLMADHMLREECYYLTKLAESTELEQPPCDPTKPRLQT